jgi:hypothetical protein
LYRRERQGPLDIFPQHPSTRISHPTSADDQCPVGSFSAPLDKFTLKISDLQGRLSSYAWGSARHVNAAGLFGPFTEFLNAILEGPRNLLSPHEVFRRPLRRSLQSLRAGERGSRASLYKAQPLPCRRRPDGTGH